MDNVLIYNKYPFIEDEQTYNITLSSISKLIDTQSRYNHIFAQKLGELVFDSDFIADNVIDNKVSILYKDLDVIDKLLSDIYNTNLTYNDNLLIAKIIIEYVLVLYLDDYHDILEDSVTIDDAEYDEYYEILDNDVEMMMNGLKIDYPKLANSFPDVMYSSKSYIPYLKLLNNEISVVGGRLLSVTVPIGWIGSTNTIIILGI